MFGYSSELYANSLTEGDAVECLSGCRGQILVRRIGGSNLSDAVSPYPLFCCENWDRLHEDIDQLKGVVSLSLVTDPFGDFEIDLLRGCFPDVMRQFKLHYVVELSDDPSRFVSKHHQRNVCVAVKKVTVREIGNPHEILDAWTKWYEHLKCRHGISGVTAFSKDSFEQQLRVPGIRVFEARHGDQSVGAAIWYVSGSHAYYHLGAWTETGYQQKASFAVFWASLTRFRDEGIQLVGLGAGSGLTDRPDGLTRFKAGWSNRQLPVYFCGRIIDYDSYRQLSTASEAPSTETFFPAYRRSDCH